MYPADNPPIPSHSSTHKLKMVSVILFVALVLSGGMFMWRIFIQERVVTLQARPGLTITFGLPANSENGPAIARILAKTGSVMKIRVSKGPYLVLFSGGSGYSPQYKNVTVSSGLVINVPTLSYTQQALDEQLNEQALAIVKALALQTSLANYSLQAGQLYLDGSWYAAKLVPGDPTQNDTELVIMHQEGGRWKLVAGPSIIFYIGDYPNIPQVVIRDINNR